MQPRPYPADVLERARRIRLIAFDVDGTLTDGTLTFFEDGRESKTFHARDGMGLVLLREAGIATAFITARDGQVVRHRAEGLRIDHIHIGERRKLACLQAIAAERRLAMEEVAFMGDDLPDLACLRAVGLAIAPADAHPWAHSCAHWATPHTAGHGAARDACDLLLTAQGQVERIIALGEHP